LRSRRISVALDGFFIFIGALLGIASNYATNSTGAPYLLRLLQRWSLPLVGGSVLLLICGRVWVYFIERPPKHSWTSTRPPFPGLESFTELDAAVFFGRDAEIEQLLDRMNPVSDSRAHRFVSVVGPSGVGKSSLVQAGLLPRLAQRRKRWVIVPPMIPENRPIGNLARVLAALLPNVDVAELTHELTSDPTALAGYTDAIRAAVGHRLASVLLVVDQAEELLTVAAEEEGYAFLSLIRNTLLRDSRLWVVATLRSEFLTGFLQAGFADLFSSPVTIGTLDRAAFFGVIERPAAKAGLTIDRDVVMAAVNDTGSGDALPLLAYTLQAIYLRVGSGGSVTLDEYRRLGGVTGALSKQADKVTAELQAEGTSADVITTLLKFVTFEGTTATRRPVRRSHLDAGERKVVDGFIEARLLTSDSAGSDVTINVAHEALFRQWAPFRQAIEARAEDIRQRSQLERWADEWVNSGRKDSYLLGGDRLASAERWAARHGSLALELPLVHEFLTRSTHSDYAALRRLSEVVARRALDCIDQDPERSVLLALAATQECVPTPLAQRALLTALGNLRLRVVVRGHTDAIRAVDWSPDGKFLVTGSHDGTARIWASESGAEVLVLRGHTDWIRDATWSPDGSRIATASNDHTVRIWDALRDTVIGVLHGHEDVIHALAWSQDANRLATGSHDGTARIWDTAHGSALTILRGHTDYVRGVAWSPDGQRIATASSDGTARLWDTRDGTELAVLRNHEDWVDDVAWSPDGQRIATASSDGTARLWDTRDGSELAVLRGHSEWVQSVGWSSDGRHVATASRDRTARIWNADDGRTLTVLRGHTEWIHDVAWSPDARSVATASQDHTMRIWDAVDSTPLTVFRGHTEWIQGVSWSPDGRSIATASHDCTAWIWRAEDAEPLKVLRGHESWVNDVAWSPDGRIVATASRDRTARIWNAADGGLLTVLRGHANWVEHIAWSPDGRCIATGSNDHTARIWEVGSGIELAELRGHADWVRGIAWSPDATRVATGSRDGTTRIWDARRGTELAVLRGHRDWIEDVSWSPDGRRIATGSNDRTARIWDAFNGKELAVLSGHEDWVGAVSWSPDGQRIATGSSDCTARIWDASGVELGVLCVHDSSVEDVAWSPDSKRIVTVSRDRTARIMDANTDLDAIAAMAHKRVLRKLTAEERRSAMLMPEPEQLEES
jgi:WD40 repeat protein